MYDLITIGGGQSGMAAVAYTARKKLGRRLLSHNTEGQVLWTPGLENYMGCQ